MKVASFTRYDMRSDQMLQPPYKKLVQSLRPEDGYILIEGTEEDVSMESLDSEGRYFPNRRNQQR